jgi:NAD-specific glutamate dehydrogenase
VRLLASCLAIGLATTFVMAADKPTEKADTSASPAPSASKQPAKTTPLILTPEREAAAIQFVREHHPELVDLLKGLKQTNAVQYQAVVRQLFQTSERLAKIHETDPPRYELELSLWKIKSRIQLLAARSSMGRDPEIETQLRAALAEQAQVQLQELQMDRDRAAERLKKLDSSIEQFQATRSRNIENQFDALMRDIDRSRQSANATAKPANPAKQQKPSNLPATPPAAVKVQP